MVYVYVIMAGLLILGLFMFFLALKAARIVLKVILIVLGLFLVLIVVVGFTVVQDIKDVKEHLSTDTLVTLKEVNGQYESGFMYLAGGGTERLDNETVVRYNGMTKDQILAGHYKIIIFTPEEIGEKELTVFQKPIALFKAYKDGEIEIYPELKTTKLIKRMPTKLIEKIVGKE